GPTILFTGVLSYPPNADAVAQFARRVLPLVRRKCPKARFSVVGWNPPPEVRRLAAAHSVDLHEHPPDVAPYYSAARAVVVPLRAGGGTRLKILEAMALGRLVS